MPTNINNFKFKWSIVFRLEDLKVLRRSPDHLNNIKIVQSTTAYNGTNFVLPYMGAAAILVK